MKSTINKIEKSQVEMFVEVTGEPWKQAQSKAFNKLAKELEIDGFRKGSVPEGIAKKHIKNDQVLMSAVEEVAQEAVVFGLEKHKLDLVATPELSIEAFSDTEAKLKFICTVKPEVTLGAYKDLGVENKKVTVSNKEVDEELESMRQRFAELVVKEGKLEMGDTAVIDFEGFKDGVAFDGGKAENHSLEIGSGQFIPGFEEKLVGMKTSEVKDIDLKFPEEYHVDDLKGADVVFNVKLHEIKTSKLPELDDDFALDTETEGVKTLTELKKHVKENIKKRKEEDASRERENEILSKVVEAATVEIPEVMTHNETHRLYDDMKMRIEQQGIPFDQFIEMTGQDKKQLMENLEIDAEKQVKLRLVLDKIAEVEKIKVNKKDIDKEYDLIAETYNMELEEVKKAIDDQNIEYDLRIRKAYDLVKDSN